MSRHPYHLTPLVFCQYHQGLIAVADKFIICLEIVKGLNVCMTVRKNIDVPTYVACFSIPNYTFFNGMYTQNTVVWSPRLKLCTPFEPHQYSPASVPLWVCNLSVNQTRSLIIFGMNPFCHSQLSGAFTMNGLWQAYLSIILLVPICKMGSCSVLQGQLA